MALKSKGRYFLSSYSLGDSVKSKEIVKCSTYLFGWLVAVFFLHGKNSADFIKFFKIVLVFMKFLK